MSYRFKKELDTTELIKWGVTAAGAIIAFFWIEVTKLNVDIAKTNKDALVEIGQYRPKAKINYTNQISSDGNLIEVRVFIRFLSRRETYIYPPKLKLFDKSGNEIQASNYTAKNLDQFKGSFPSNIDHQINYSIDVSALENNQLGEIEMEYLIQTNAVDVAPLKFYVETLDELFLVENKSTKYLSRITEKKLTYRERIYQNGHNPTWSDFWSNPR